ncbi:MAG: sigma-70 family RNA polymerase sigma factor [Candidatus Poribacteria bacterium]|nr:sigma-70 family RNA polymerase sigma factor [Candidatus Poribacteria bacterium]
MKHNDTELIQQILSGNDDAFSTLVRKYQKQVHALAWRIIGDFHIAEEITQDAFLKAYMELKNLKEPQRFAGWLSVITRRRCFAWLRKKRMGTQSLEHLEESDSEQIEEAAYSEYVVEEKERTAAETQRDVVKKLLAKLQESERTVMTLHYFGEMTCAEIGEFLGVSANTIKSRLRRAQQRLQRHEPIIREALEHFKITPNLTDSTMREISQTKPAAPSASKPFVPWLFAASTVVVVLLMLGIGNSKFLSRFQEPYDFDANSEVTVEIIEAPVMANLALKSDVRRQLGSVNAQSENLISEQKPNDTPLSTEAGEENKMENYPQWHLPEKAEARLGKGGLGTIHFSPDGRQLAVSSQIGMWNYDVKTGEAISLIPNLRGGVVYSPDGCFIATTGEDLLTSFGGSHLEKGVVLWDIATASEVSTQDVLPPATAMRFSDDSKTLVYLSLSRETIYRVGVETGKTTLTNMGERPGHMHRESYALTAGKIAIGGSKGKIELWDTKTGKKLFTLREFGKKVIMWDHIAYTNHAITMEFSPDGTRLATGNLDTTVQLWDATSGEELIVLQKPVAGNAWSVSKEDGKEIVNNPMKEERLGRPFALAFSPDGSLLACGSEDSTIKLWNSSTGELVATFTGHLGTVGSLAFSSDGNILATGSSGGTVQFWDIEMRKALPTKIVGHLRISTASFFDGGSKLASVSKEGIITNWDLQNSQKTTLQTKAKLEEPLFWSMWRNLVLSPDGTIFANNGIQSDPSKPNFGEDIFRLTDVNTGRELAAFPSSNGEVFSPDGKILASGVGNKIRLLNTETGKKRDIITSDHEEDSDEHKPLVRTVAFSPDGRKIVSGTMGGQVQLWDVETGAELSSFFEEIPPKGNTYQEPILNLAFSSDGALIAAISPERIRMIGRAKLQHFKEVPIKHPEFCETIIFSQDNTVLTAGYRGGKIRLWDVPTGDLLTSLDGHTRWIQELKITSNNQTLISVGDGTILFWDWEKVLANARGNDQEPASDVNLPIEKQSTENVLQFLERSQQKPKTSKHILTNGEIYLANEWYDEALVQFKRYLSAADYKVDQNVTTPSSFHRKLFAKIGKVGKDVQDKAGFADMVNQLINHFSDSESIQLNAHMVLAEFYHDNDMLKKADEHFQKTGFVTENAWMVLGPFDNAGGIGYDTAYIPEDITQINLNAKYDGLNGTASWQKCTDDTQDGNIRFGKDLDWCVAYAFATVTSPDEREVQFRFDSDDQGKVWLNGVEVYVHTKSHSAEIDRYTVPVTLKQGKNSILVKVCEEEEGWGFYLRITDQNGQAFDDLKINRNVQN